MTFKKKDFSKMMNNANFEKTIENLRKQLLATRAKRSRKS